MDDFSLDLDSVRIWFGLHSFVLMGHTPNTEVNSLTKGDKQPDRFGFDLDKMSFVEMSEGIYSVNHLKLIRLSLSNNTATDKTYY